MNTFLDQYKTYSNSDLLRVIQNRSDYQLEAVEAAKTELQHRKLSDQEIEEANNELEIERLEIENQNLKRAKAKKKVFAVFEFVNPFQKSEVSLERRVNLICLVFGIIVLYNWYVGFGSLEFYINEGFLSWDLSVVQYLLPILFLPIALIFFGLRKRIGWILMTGYISYAIINYVVILIFIWNFEPENISIVDQFIPMPSLSLLIMAKLFYGSTLWVLLKKEMLERFRINKQTLIITLIWALTFCIWLLAPYL